MTDGILEPATKPLTEGCSEETISANIARLIEEGKPRDQAVAIAHANCRDSKDAPTIKDEYTYFTGGAVKAATEGILSGLLVPFGLPKDSQGEYFHDTVKLFLERLKYIPVMFHHAMSSIGTKEIGRIEIGDCKVTPDGLEVEKAQLYMDLPEARWAFQEAARGKLGWSSASAPHLVVRDDDGGISEWPLVEATLTPNPAGGRRTTVQALKFDVSTLTSGEDAAKEPDTAEEPAQHSPSGELAATSAVKTNSPRGMRMTTKTMKGSGGLIGALESAGVAPDQIVAVLKEMEAGAIMAEETTADVPPPPDATMADADVTEDPEVAPGSNAPDAGTPPASNPAEQGYVEPSRKNAKAVAGKGSDLIAMSPKQFAALMQQKFAGKTDDLVLPVAPSRAGGGVTIEPRQPQITVKSKYHDLSPEDMAYYWQIAKARDWDVRNDPKFLREIAVKAKKAYDGDKLDLAEKHYRTIAVKADFNNTLVAGDGGNWVPDLWSSSLWPRVRVDNNVAKNIEVFQMPSPTYEYPIESTDPVVYTVAQADDDAESTLDTNVFTRSKLSVDKIQFSAGKAGLQVVFSTELEEDSIIPWIPQLRAQATRAFANFIDYALLNTDSTTGTGNINYKGANTSAAPTSRFLFAGGNGMRYNALIANPAVLSNAQGGVPTLALLRAARFNLISALNAYGIDPKLLMYLVDPYTYGKMLQIDEVLNAMVNGRGSTVNDGMIPAIDGSPIFPSAELALTDSTGYAMADGSGTLGQVVIAVKPAWKVGYIRQVNTDVSYIPWNDVYVLTMTARFAIGKKDTTASALIININVD